MQPKLDYLTLADKYILACNVFISAMVFQIGFVALAQSHFSVAVSTVFDTCLLAANTAALVLVHFILFWTVKYKVMPVEKAKLATSSEKLNESTLAEINVSYRKFHTDVVDDNKGVQKANYLGSDQIEGQSITGLFFSDDYGHGREYFAVSVCVNGNGGAHLLLRKVTGDENVPAGRLSILTDGEIPAIGGGAVPGKCQIRSDINDKNGFSYEAATVAIEDFDTITADIAEWSCTMTYHRAMKDNYDEDAAGDCIFAARSSSEGEE